MAWRSRDRWLGTLIWPGGLFAPIYLASIPGGSQVCTGSRCVTTGFILPAAVGVPLLLLTILAPVAVAIHLDRVRRLEMSPRQMLQYMQRGGLWPGDECRRAG